MLEPRFAVGVVVYSSEYLPGEGAWKAREQDLERTGNAPSVQKECENVNISVMLCTKIRFMFVCNVPSYLY